MNSQLPEAFFAYPSTPKSIPETIKLATEAINNSKTVYIRTWEQSRVGGKFVADEVCAAIDKSSLVLADLTTLNPNVLFEIGFAIAKNKRIWLVLDQSLNNNDFSELHTLSTIGYAQYTNSADIQRAYFRERPHEDLKSTLRRSMIEPSLLSGSPPTLLYLKSLYETDASAQIGKRIDKAPIKKIFDDPEEARAQTLTWYGQQVYTAEAVVCHFTNPERQGSRIRNARHALVAGMAHGMGKRVLMLSEGEYLAPLDYRDMLRQYQTASAASRHVDAWLFPLEEGWAAEARKVANHKTSLRLATELRALDVGEYIAENEGERLIDGYFIETTAYQEALAGTHTIFVGRKGTGKSANFLHLRHRLESDTRNVLSIIKPVAYELESVLKILSDVTDKDRKVYTMEGLWKYLLYSEAAAALAGRIHQKPIASLSPKETKFLEFCDHHEAELKGDFSTRLERCIGSLEKTAKLLAENRSTEEYRTQISRLLHSEMLRHLRDALIESLPRGARIAIIVDNLDKAWDRQNDLRLVAEFLLGLLSAANKLKQELKNKLPNLEVSLAVFLRADIFERVQEVAREPDKISYTRLVWTDKQMLFKLLAERFAAINTDDVPPDTLWNQFFCPTVSNQETKDYLASVVLPRPRDFIYLTRTAISTAVNRGHARVEEDDVLEATRLYSEFASGILLIEDNSQDNRLEKVLFEFAGAPAILRRSEILARIQCAGVSQQESAQVLEQLCTLSFLGIEVGDSDFRYPDNSSELKKVAVLSRRLCEHRGHEPRYRIHVAFHGFLEVSQD